MSQPSSSIVSADNADIKYKKALKEISKLISANRVLRESSEKNNIELKEKIDELSLRYEDLEKEYQIVRKEKETFAHYLDEIQKQRNNLQRQNAYLSDCFSEQTAELKKLQLHKDQKAIAHLIRTYEEKEAVMKRNRSQNEDMISNLKSTIDRLENEIQQQREQREDYEDRYNSLEMELSKYKEMNANLMAQNERLLSENGQKDSYSTEKEKQLQVLISEFKSQITMLKVKSEERPDSQNARYIENYEYIVTEKNKLEAELSRIQDAYEEAISREKEYFEIEEKMKSANIRADRAQEEVNMLRNKIVVIEAKEFLDEAGDDDYDQKEFEARLNDMLIQNDPLASLKNGEDTSHFRILKSFIVDLQEKIYKQSIEKKEATKKYKSIKSRFVKTAEQLKFYEEQNKMMKGKLEGYERLSEKLHFELEKSLASNEEEITRMTITSNNILAMKSEEYKAAISVLNSQLEVTQDKAFRTEKNIKQEIETLKLELDTMKIKYRDEAETFRKQSQLIEIYKKKNSELSTQLSELEEQLIEANQTASSFQELFKEEKSKNEGLVSQKQQLISQNKQLTEQLDRKSYLFNENARSKQENYEYELKRVKSDNIRLKEELQYLNKQTKSMRRQVEEKRHSDQIEVQEIKRLNNKNLELEEKLEQMKKKFREINEENDTLKIKAKKYQENFQKYNRHEEELINKTDKINDLQREKLILENDLRSLEGYLNEEKKITAELQKEISSNKIKSLESTHNVKKELDSKLFETKKIIQTLNQDISDLTSELKEEKSKNLRLNNQLGNIKAEKNRLQEVIDQNRKKDYQSQNQAGNLKLELSSAGMQIQRLKNQLKSQQSSTTVLNEEIEGMQQKIFSLNQEISSLKMKIETSEEEKRDLVRDLNSIKYNFSAVEAYNLKLKSTINQPWEEQNFTTSLSDVVNKVKKIGRNYGVTFDTQQVSSIDSHTSSVDRQNDYYTTFKSYAGGDVNSSNKGTISGIRVAGMGNVSLQLDNSGHSNRQFESKIGTTESIRQSGTTDYLYSESNFGTRKGLDDIQQPSYDYRYQPSNPSSSSNQQIDFKFSSNLIGSSYRMAEA